MVYCLWFTVYGLRFMVYGLWFTVYRFEKFEKRKTNGLTT